MVKDRLTDTCRYKDGKQVEWNMPVVGKPQQAGWES